MEILHAQVIGEGKPFIILHGFLGMGDNWRTLGRRFSELGYQVHLVDQRNHGRSFHDSEFTYELMVEDLRKYMEANHLSDAVVLGHSMGGKTAMLFATTYPDLVSKLIVADIAPKAYPQHHQAILKALSLLDFADKTTGKPGIETRQEAEEVLAEYIDSWSIRQFLLKNLYWKTKEQLALRINLPVLIENIEEVGKGLDEDAVYKGDTLFLHGGASDYIQLGDEILIARHFPNNQIKAIPEVGHWLHAQNPKEFFNIVNGFL